MTLGTKKLKSKKNKEKELGTKYGLGYKKGGKAKKKRKK